MSISRRLWIISFLVLVLATSWGHTSEAAPCLASGDPTTVLGASVATFESLGVNPAVTCIENSVFTDPTGFGLGTYVKGAEGLGGTPDPRVLTFDGSNLGSNAANANARDFFWVQDGSANVQPGGVSGSGPSTGLIWDLGGQANQAAVFSFVDHGPLPGEALESTVWLSNDPNAADGGWTQAILDHVYLQGWSSNPDPTLNNIADGFTGVYMLPGGATFQFVSVTWGGPSAFQRDGENEIDAVGGLTASGGCVGANCNAVPEPATLLLLGSGLGGLFLLRYRRKQI